MYQIIVVRDLDVSNYWLGKELRLCLLIVSQFVVIGW